MLQSFCWDLLINHILVPFSPTWKNRFLQMLFGHQACSCLARDWGRICFVCVGRSRPMCVYVYWVQCKMRPLWILLRVTKKPRHLTNNVIIKCHGDNSSVWLLELDRASFQTDAEAHGCFEVAIKRLHGDPEKTSLASLLLIFAVISSCVIVHSTWISF